MRVALAIGLSLALSWSQAFAQSRPPGVRPPLSSVEGGLWAEADRAELAAKTSAQLIDDPKLHAYVKDIACRLAEEYCGDLRVYVLDRPYFNAGMAPNGYMEVWSGLLLRAADEDQVAFVMGHEIGHYAENHGLELWNQLKGGMTGAMIVGMVVPLVGTLGALFAILAYSRDQENEADRYGFDRAVASGYDPNAGAAIWRALVNETAASDFPKVRKSEARGSIFNTHPLTRDRIAALDKRAAGRTGAADAAASRKRLRDVIRPHLATWLRDDLRRRDYGQTLDIIRRLEVGGDDMGLLEYFRGEVYRVRRAAGDTELARDAYISAVRFADAPPAAWRELGEMHKRLGDKSAAIAAFQSYLKLAPTADDVWLVEDAIKSLQGAAS